MSLVTKTLMIPASVLPSFEGEIASLIKRANKLGVTAPVMIKTGRCENRARTSYVIEGNFPAVGATWMEEFVEITLVAQRVVLPGGWRIIGRLESTLDGKMVVVSGAVDVEIPAEWRTAQGIKECDHCNTERNRTHTIVLQDAAGKMIKVGSACVRDFTGSKNDPILLADIAAQIDRVINMSADDFDREGGGSGRILTFDIESSLRLAAQCVLDGTYISGSVAYDTNRVSTAAKIRLFALNNLVVTDEAIALAAATLQWVRSLTDVSSEYMKNLTALVANGAERVLSQHLGLLVSAIPTYQRALADAQKEKLPEIDAHLGTVGEKVETQGWLVNVVPVESLYGTSLLHILRTVEGHNLAWFCSGARPEVNVGDKVYIYGTVKAHDVRNGKKQTGLTRAVLRDTPAPAKKSTRKSAN